MHPNPRIIAPVLLLGLSVIFGWMYLNNQRAQANIALPDASGTIEATQVHIVSELGGHVLDILVQEGDYVRTGQTLIKFDGALLTAQLGQAEATLAQAEANYELVAAGPTPEQRQLAISAAELELLSAQQALDDLYDQSDLMAANLLQQIAQAEKTIDASEKHLNNLLSESSQADIDAAEATVILAKDKLDRAREDYAPYEKKPETNLTRAALLSQVSAAQKVYDAAVIRLNNLRGDANQIDLDLVEADLAMAESQLADAKSRYEILNNGPDPDDVALIEAQVEVAQAHLATAQANPSQEQLDLAKSQVEVARAALEVIHAQMDKLILVAPSDGIVLNRSVEPGEVVAPGAPLLTLAKLDTLNLTIYVQEDRYGTIQLGQPAQVLVDSFPDEQFPAIVVKIADQAEFTPRNVQTEEGRRTTVFGVKLSVENPAGKLKPGMPADVIFDSK